MADDLNAVNGDGTAPGTDADPAAFSDGADAARPAGIPRSYAQGGSARWTPGTIADIQAKAQLGRYQIRGFSTFQRQLPDIRRPRLPAGDDDAAAARGLPRELRYQDRLR